MGALSTKWGRSVFFSHLCIGWKCTHKGSLRYCSRVFTCASACTRMRLCQFLYKRFYTQIYQQSQLWFTCITWIYLKICDIMRTVSVGIRCVFLSSSLFIQREECFGFPNVGLRTDYIQYSRGFFIIQDGLRTLFCEISIINFKLHIGLMKNLAAVKKWDSNSEMSGHDQPVRSWVRSSAWTYRNRFQALFSNQKINS